MDKQRCSNCQAACDSEEHNYARILCQRCRHLQQCPRCNRLSVTEVLCRIIANLGFKFRSHFTVHCGRSAAGEQHGTRQQHGGRNAR